MSGGAPGIETPAPYPLLLEPILLEKVWGGRRLERLGKELPPGKLIGESWEVADLGATSASGAGGGAKRSIIANGPLAGRTLHDAIQLWGDDLISRDKLTPEGNFPLLVKFLDARENLSVQVHPSPAYAAAHPDAHLKTECWYILDAEPGSVIYKGLKPGTTPDALREAIARGTVPDLLEAVPARRGDMHLLPSGTVHALGAGVLVAEIQTPSDTTFRLYDWGRTGRDLHVQEGLACIDFEQRVPALTRLADGRVAGPPREPLVRTGLFTVDGVRLGSGQSFEAAPSTGCTVVMLVDGAADLTAGGKEIRVASGQTAVIPALGLRLSASSPVTALLAIP